MARAQLGPNILVFTGQPYDRDLLAGPGSVLLVRSAVGEEVLSTG